MSGFNNFTNDTACHKYDYSDASYTSDGGYSVTSEFSGGFSTISGSNGRYSIAYGLNGAFSTNSASNGGYSTVSGQQGSSTGVYGLGVVYSTGYGCRTNYGSRRSYPAAYTLNSLNEPVLSPSPSQSTSRDPQSTSSGEKTYPWYDYKPPLMTSEFSFDSDIENCGVTSTTDHGNDPLLQLPSLSNEKSSVDHVSSTSDSKVEKDCTRLENDDADTKYNFVISKESRRAADEPRRPKNSFIRFSVENRLRVAQQHPLMDNREVSKILGSLWKSLTPEQKKPYEVEFSKDMEAIRSENPDWQYVPTNRLAAELVEPMPRRLRPRNRLKKKMYNSPKVYRKRRVVSKQKRTSSTYGKRHTSSGSVSGYSDFTHVTQPQEHAQSSAMGTSDVAGRQEEQTWVQCDVCYKWRRLPRAVSPSQLPDVWLCELNPDRHHKSCLIPEEI